MNFIKENKGSSENVGLIVNQVLSDFGEHYDSDKNHDHIASTDQDSYSAMKNAVEGEEVENAICTTIHQNVASALNDAGIKAHVVTADQIVSEDDDSAQNAAGNHAVLIYESGDGKYTLNI